MRRTKPMPTKPELPSDEDAILALPAGRGLDMLVAELMGDTYDAKSNWWNDKDGSKKSSCYDGGPMHYSSDISAAWHVHTKMCKLKPPKPEVYAVVLKHIAKAKAKTKRQKSFQGMELLLMLSNAMPEAICTAALIASRELPEAT